MHFFGWFLVSAIQFHVGPDQTQPRRLLVAKKILGDGIMLFCHCVADDRCTFQCGFEYPIADMNEIFIACFGCSHAPL